jgi:GT2 family glycosyltransferase
MKTYVVMPHFIFNEELKQLAKNAIESFRKTSDAIIINVDDSSPDGEFLKELSDVYLRTESNDGFARACNTGFRWILDNVPEECFIVCANNDIEVYPGWEKTLEEPFDMYEGVGITGMVSNKERTLFGTPLEKWSKNKITSGGFLDGWMQSGGLWGIKKSILQKVGLFDEQFKRGGLEDVDLFMRIRDTYKLKLIMSARSIFWHKEGATRWRDEPVGEAKSYKEENKEIEEENLQKFTKKWGYNYWTKQIFFEEVLPS